MPLTRKFAAMLGVCALATVALAQPAAPVPVRRIVDVATGKSVLNHVPASALGVLVVNSVEGTATAVDKYIADLGLTEMVKENMPGGALATLTKALKLGKGFDPKGGFAVFMLNPKDFGMDLMEMFQGGGAAPAEKGAAEKPKPKPPVVLLVAGTSAENVFAAYKPVKDGKFTTVTFKEGKDPGYCLQIGSYIALSPSKAALEATVASTKPMLATIKPRETKMLLASAAALHLNMKALGPELQKAIKMVTAMMTMGAPENDPQAELGSMMLSGISETIGELNGLSIAARFGKTGLVLEGLLTFKPKSPYANYFQPPAPGQNVLSKVPDLPYVLAIGTTQLNPEAVKGAQQKSMSVLDPLFRMADPKQFPPEQQAKVKKLLTGLGEQVTAAQFVAGGPANDTGLFGVSLVLSCKDAGKLRGLLAESVATADAMIKAMVPDPDVKDLKLAYQKGVEVVGGTRVDAITISHPDLVNMSEEERAQMKLALGEDKIRLLVGAVDNKTVVVTFGGGQAMMAKALATAKAGTGKILAGKDVLPALAEMPKTPAYLILLSPGNLMDVVLKGVQRVEPKAADEIPFRIKCKTPIALGLGQEKGAWHVAIYVPNKLAQEVVQLAMGFLMPMGPTPGPAGPPPAPVPGGEDF